MPAGRPAWPKMSAFLSVPTSDFPRVHTLILSLAKRVQIRTDSQTLFSSNQGKKEIVGYFGRMRSSKIKGRTPFKRCLLPACWFESLPLLPRYESHWSGSSTPSPAWRLLPNSRIKKDTVWPGDDSYILQDGYIASEKTKEAKEAIFCIEIRIMRSIHPTWMGINQYKEGMEWQGKARHAIWRLIRGD